VSAEFVFDFGLIDDPIKRSERLQREGDVSGAKVRPGDAPRARAVRNRAELAAMDGWQVKPNGLA